MSYRNPVNGRAHGEHTWCSQCEQVHPTSRWERRDWFCPAGCGGTALDALPWEFVREANRHYPMTPEAGRHYLWHAHHAGEAARVACKEAEMPEEAVLR